MAFEHAHSHTKLRCGEVDRSFQVGIVGNDDRDLAVGPERIQEQERREVDVRAFLVGAYDLDEGRQPGNGRGQRHGNDVAEKVPVMNFKASRFLTITRR